MQKTLVLVKPDGVQKNLIGEIIARFERRSLKVCALKMMQMTPEQAKVHYHEHVSKPFFPELSDFITSGPLVAMVIRGDNAIKAVRGMMGVTNPLEAAPGSIRADYALKTSENIVHGSDSEDSAAKEVANFFEPCEIF